MLQFHRHHSYLKKDFQILLAVNIDHMSRVMRKPAFCICENKDADQLCGNRGPDQCLCFRYTDNNPSTSYIRNFKPLAIFCSSTDRFVSDLVGNPKTGFLTMRLIYSLTMRLIYSLTMRLIYSLHIMHYM